MFGNLLHGIESLAIDPTHVTTPKGMWVFGSREHLLVTSMYDIMESKNIERLFLGIPFFILNLSCIAKPDISHILFECTNDNLLSDEL